MVLEDKKKGYRLYKGTYTRIFYFDIDKISAEVMSFLMYSQQIRFSHHL